jgi:GT2 family glycosyltransferase
MQPDLSVIILSYNTRDLTLACLSSFLNEPDPAIQIETIVVDNCSTDNSVNDIRSQFPYVRIIVNTENLGFARGNNVGFAAATGRYLFALNSDTEVAPGALRELVVFMDSNPTAGACSPMLVNSDGSLQPTGRPLPTVWSLFVDMTRLWRLWKKDLYEQPGRDYSQIVQVGEISGAAMCLRRDAYEKTGGFDPNIVMYYEDVDLCKRISDLGYTIYYVPSARVMHHWGGSSKRASAYTYIAGQNSTRYYFRKHHGHVAAAAVSILLMGKELLYMLACTIKRDQDGKRFHTEALKRLLV